MMTFSASETVKDEKEIAEKTYFDRLIDSGNCSNMTSSYGLLSAKFDFLQYANRSEDSLLLCHLLKISFN